MNKYVETYYQVLKVDRRATVAEIVSAYHAARGAFSKDSIATYSLFSPEEIQEELEKLEQAYVTLSNIDKRADYDRRLDGGEEMPALPVKTKTAEPAAASPAPGNLSVVPAASNEPPAPIPDLVNGGFLKETREKKGLSVDDVARITKIPLKFLRAIEADDLPGLPARVYIQGFIKNIASLYRLDAKPLARGYLAFIDSQQQPPPPTP